MFIPQYRLDSLTKDKRYVDGALLHELRVPFGYWEAKDVADDIDEEIARKFKRGYPQDNIIFEDSTQAVLIQHREEVMRCPVADVAQLEKLLKLFFGFERAEIADFRQAVQQFKTDLPAVLEALRGMIERHDIEKHFGVGLVGRHPETMLARHVVLAVKVAVVEHLGEDLFGQDVLD